MEVALPFIISLGLRLFFAGHDHSLSRVILVFVGLWEGVVMHHLSNNALTSEHYLVFALHALLDLFWTGSLITAFMGVIWAILGAVASTVLSSPPEQHRRRRQMHRSSRTKEHRGNRHRHLHMPHVFVHDTLPLNPPDQTPPRPLIPMSPPAIATEQVESSGPLSLPTVEPGSYAPADYSQGSQSVKFVPPPDQSVEEELEAPITDFLQRAFSGAEVSSTNDTNSDEDDAREVRDLPNAVVSVGMSPCPSSPGPFTGPLLASSVKSDHVQPKELLLTGTTFSQTPPPYSPLRRQTVVNPQMVTMSEGSDELGTPDRKNWDIAEATDHDELLTPPRNIPFPTHSRPSNLKVVSDLTELSLLPYPSRAEAHAAPSGLLANETAPHASSSSQRPRLTLFSSADAKSHDARDQILPPLSPDADTEIASVVSKLDTRALLYQRAEQIRQEAFEEDKKCQTLKDQLDKATKDGKIKDVVLLQYDIRQAEARAKKLHARAARRFILARNPNQDSQMIDVHGLRVPEALEITEKALRDAILGGHSSLRIIVGKGLHSRNKVPVLKNRVIAKMQSLNIPHTIDSSNTGVLIINVPR